jgi:hypothetical protein
MGKAMLVGIANGLRVWLHDGQPSQDTQPSRANVPGCVFIGVFTVAAAPANEKALRLPVRLFGVTTFAALLAGVFSRAVAFSFSEWDYACAHYQKREFLWY